MSINVLFQSGHLLVGFSKLIYLLFTPLLLNLLVFGEVLRQNIDFILENSDLVSFSIEHVHILSHDVLGVLGVLFDFIF